MKVILIHGIHSKEGANNMSELLPHLQRNIPDIEIKLHQYGFMGFWAARWKNAYESRRLAELIEPGDIVVTHSNGAAIAYLAVRDSNSTPSGIVNINPALDRWRTSMVPWVETIYSEGDRWVWLSQWLPGHIWGDQGRVGYRGIENNTINHDASKFGGVMAYQDHCDLFSKVRIEQWAAFIANRIYERVDEAEHWKRQGDKLRALIDLAGKDI